MYEGEAALSDGVAFASEGEAAPSEGVAFVSDGEAARSDGVAALSDGEAFPSRFYCLLLPVTCALLSVCAGGLPRVDC